MLMAPIDVCDSASLWKLTSVSNCGGNHNLDVPPVAHTLPGTVMIHNLAPSSKLHFCSVTRGPSLPWGKFLCVPKTNWFLRPTGIEPT